MDVGVNKPFKDYDWQEHEKVMVANVDNMKVSREDVVFWMDGGWEMVKVERITRTWANIGCRVLTTNVSYMFSGVIF